MIFIVIITAYYIFNLTFLSVIFFNIFLYFYEYNSVGKLRIYFKV